MGYKCFTLWLSNKGYGIFVDNMAKSIIDIGKSASDELWAEFQGGKLDYYFFKGDMKSVLDGYTQLTGRPYMAPKWSLGYQQCKWAFATRAELQGIADTFRLKQIPCDALWLDGPGNGWWKNHINWSGEFDARYPNPADMISYLHSKGFRLCLLENHTMDNASQYYQAGATSNYYVKNQDGSIFISSQWNGNCATVDFTNSAAASWFAGLHKGLTDMGIDGWWIDMDDGGMPESRDGYTNRVFTGGPGWKVHNCNGGLLDAQACYNYLKSYKSAQRPFYMTRGGASGMQRCAWTWSADLVFDSWSDLQYQLRMEQNMSLCGVVYTSDIGGCNGVLKGNGESYLRWLQMELFNFFTRTHFNGSTVNAKYPWTYGSTVEAHAIKWIEWKYKMLPYIYTEHYNYTQNGSPIHRALVYSYPNDNNVFNMADEFMFGDWLLVAPVVSGNNTTGASNTTRNVYLPAGTWIDYTDGKTIRTGGQTLSNYAAPLSVVPIFVKAGAIIPMQPVLQYVGEKMPTPITLDIYPSGNSSYTMYEDDGITFNHEKGVWAKTRFDCSAGSEVTTVTINARQGSFNPGARDYLLKLHLVNAMSSVSLNGTALASKPYADLNNGQAGWNYDAANKLAYARFADSGSKLTVAFNHTTTGIINGQSAIGAPRIDLSMRGKISAFCDNTQSSFTLKLIDLRGKTVASIKARSVGTISTGRLSSGSYSIILETGSTILKKNIVILK
jgi:alpha-glucosidase